MRKIVAVIFVLSLAVVGCTTTQEGATVGGLGGATLGGIIGHQSGHGVAGAAIGGAAGAVGGMLVGGSMEKKFCPQCGRSFKNDVTYCPYDGTALKEKN